MLLAVDTACVALCVDSGDDVTVSHVPVLVFPEEPCLFLELYYGDGLVHHRCQPALFLVYDGVAVEDDWLESYAGVVAVVLHGECGEGDKVDAISLLKGREVGIAQADAYDMAYACVITGSGSHPQYVVVAPLYIPRVVFLQRVHNDVCAGPAVVYIAEDVQLVYGEALYDIADGDDEII